jgi:hypothetical protein
MPTCSPSTPIRRIDLARILSFTLVVSTRIAHHPFLVEPCDENKKDGKSHLLTTTA